nr:hypothetical protein [uncultured Capnocytophaga sp.]
MGTSKFNKNAKRIIIVIMIITAIIIARIIISNYYEKQKEELSKKCFYDSNIGFYHKEFSFYFPEELELQGAQILQIHNQDTIVIDYRILGHNIVINSPKNLKSEDIIKIILKDTVFTLRDFRNGPRFGGGSVFLGCFLEECVINNRKKICDDAGIFMFFSNL